MFVLTHTNKNVTIVKSCEQIELKTEYKDGILTLEYYLDNKKNLISLEITKYALYFNGNFLGGIDIEDFN